MKENISKNYEEVFCCDVCSELFKDKQSLRVHKFNTHEKSKELVLKSKGKTKGGGDLSETSSFSSLSLRDGC